MTGVLGFIDIGSNTVRLAVFQVRDTEWRLIDEEKRVMRLGAALDGDGFLSPAAMQHLAEVLQEFVTIGRADGVDRFIAAATAAVRQARNQAEVLSFLRQETGLTVEVLSGEEEARLGAVGALNTLEIQDAFVVDIGGASTEITLVKGRELIESVSLPIGAVNMTEHFLTGGAADSRQLKALEAYIDDRLAALPWLTLHKELPVVGLGGTIRTLGKVHRSSTQYPLPLIHNYRLTASDLHAVFRRVTAAQVAERRRIPGMNKERADIIAGGAAIVARIMSRTGAERLIVSGSGLREGLLFREILQGAILPDVLAASTRNLMAQFGVSAHAALHVTALALSLYDQLQPLHGLQSRERRLLETAALLHTVGVAINYYNWQDQTFHILVSIRLFGLSNAEQVLVAATAGFKSGLKERLAPYASILPQEADRLVRYLGILLVLARSLDRSATQAVQGLHVDLAGEAVILNVIADSDVRVELQAARSLAADFARAFNRDLVLRGVQVTEEIQA